MFKKIFYCKIYNGRCFKSKYIKFYKEKTNDDIKKKFVGVFPSNFITKIYVS